MPTLYESKVPILKGSLNIMRDKCDIFTVSEAAHRGYNARHSKYSPSDHNFAPHVHPPPNKGDQTADTAKKRKDYSGYTQARLAVLEHVNDYNNETH